MTAFAQIAVSLYQDPKGIHRSCPGGACHYHHQPGPVQTQWDGAWLMSMLPMWR